MIHFVTSGIWTTIQDLGRFGYRKFGIPTSGPMDILTSIKLNKIIGNQINSAVFELMINGPILFFDQDCWVALSSAVAHAKLEGKDVPTNKAVHVKAGQTLQVGKVTNGRYGYLAVKGGIQSEIVMNSRSQFYGISSHQRCVKGMQVAHLSIPNETILKRTHQIRQNRNVIFKVFKGPEYSQLSTDVQLKLMTTKWLINPNSNRIGIRFESDEELTAPEIISSPVYPGVIQLTPSGELIVLGRDAGVSGGYARVLILEEGELSRMAQVDDSFGVELTFES